MTKDKKILLISPESWGPNHLSKHLYGKYLSKDNDVYFLNPVSSSKNNPFGSIELGVSQEANGLKVVDYKNLMPRLNKMPKGIQSSQYRNMADQIHSLLKIEEFDIVWSFDPFRFWNLRCFKGAKYIYHSVDFHPHAKFEEAACRSAQLVIAVTEKIKKQLQKYRPDVFNISHGADIDGFSKVKEVELPGSNSVKACYVGNFHRDIDYGILLQLVKENPEVDFIMIGPTLDSNLSKGNMVDQGLLKDLDSNSNIFFLGSIPSDQLMSYLNKCDINLVLFKKEQEEIHCSPHKLMAYFYSGHFTLSNYIDEHQNIDSRIIQMVKHLKDVPSEFKSAVSKIDDLNSPSLQEMRRNFAMENSYPHKILEISKLLEQC